MTIDVVVVGKSQHSQKFRIRSMTIHAYRDDAVGVIICECFAIGFASMSLADSEKGHWPARPHHRPKLSVFDQRPLDRRVNPAIGQLGQLAREQLLPLTGSDVDRFRQSPARGL